MTAEPDHVIETGVGVETLDHRQPTRRLARAVAAGSAKSRYIQITDALGNGPATIFEVAARLHCFDHQISGRFGELELRGLIRKTGEKKRKPETGCLAEVYAIAR